jgi:methylmalonyl-CoA mutase
MTKTLFDEFEKSSSKAWKQQIQVDLKGADYNENLIWQTEEGIDVKPFYHPDDFNTENFTTSKHAGSWKVGQIIHVTDEQEGNVAAKNAISKGAETILFKIASETVNIERLVKDLENIPYYFEGILPDSHDGSRHLYFDPIGHLASTGNWIQSKDKDMAAVKTWVGKSGQLILDTSFYQNAGANMVQQLAYTMAQVNEYLNAFNEEDNIDVKALTVHFHIALGGNYFFEIAKIRALRLLWQSLSKLYNNTAKCTISVVPSRRNKSIYDYNVNLLRTTTECMSAILGGADIVYNEAYDALYHPSNDFGDRIARNQLLILKHESYFNQVTNPSDGAYYIESLTDQLASKALDLLKSIEKAGGFLAQLMTGTIQKKIKENAQAEQDKFDAGELILLGVNAFPNKEDKMKHDLLTDPFMKVSKRKTLIEPIVQKRLSEALEKQRLEQE